MVNLSKHGYIYDGNAYKKTLGEYTITVYVSEENKFIRKISYKNQPKHFDKFIDFNDLESDDTFKKVLTAYNDFLQNKRIDFGAIGLCGLEKEKYKKVQMFDDTKEIRLEPEEIKRRD